MISFTCETTDGVSYAVILNGDTVLDRKACDSKHDAMALRDRARNARVLAFDHIYNPPPLSVPGSNAAPRPMRRNQKEQA